MTSLVYLILLLGASVFTAAYQTQTGWLYFIGALSLALLGVAALAARWDLRSVRCEARPVADAEQGEGAQVVLRLSREAAGRSAGVQVGLPARPPGRIFRIWRGSLVPRHWLMATVPAFGGSESAEVAFHVPTPTRGAFPLPAFYLQSAFPLGLTVVGRTFAPPGEYLVLPVGPSLPHVPWLAPMDDRSGERQGPDQGHGLLLRGVREYRSGDSWRQIHWRTTARRGQPFVKETEREEGEALTLVLDLRDEVHTAETLEHLITVAASLLAYARGQRREIVLATQPEAAPGPDGRLASAQRAWLAMARTAEGAGAPVGPPGAVLLSPTYVPGWQQWAAQFVYCPPGAANPLDATAYCAVGMPIPAALALERQA